MVKNMTRQKEHELTLQAMRQEQADTIARRKMLEEETERITNAIEVKYFNKDLLPLEINPKGNMIDLRCAETVDIPQGTTRRVKLGIGMRLPKGKIAKVYPRSSTCKKWGVLLTNSVGIIDESYCGDEDEWQAELYAIRDTHIDFNDRILQFEICDAMEMPTFVSVEHLDEVSRGNYGSTGAK